MRLYVSGIPYRWRDDDLNKVFSEYGTVIYAHVRMNDNIPSRSLGYGFVEMADPANAHEAMIELDGSEVMEGRKLKVQEVSNSRNART